MTWKFPCPGCNTHTSDNSRRASEEGKCPACGLSIETIREIWRVREGHANDEVKAQFEQLAVRAGLAEAKGEKLERTLGRIREAMGGDDD
jgi:hypothetical protein